MHARTYVSVSLHIYLHALATQLHTHVHNALLEKKTFLYVAVGEKGSGLRTVEGSILLI